MSTYRAIRYPVAAASASGTAVGQTVEIDAEPPMLCFAIPMVQEAASELLAQGVSISVIGGEGFTAGTCDGCLETGAESGQRATVNSLIIGVDHRNDLVRVTDAHSRKTPYMLFSPYNGKTNRPRYKSDAISFSRKRLAPQASLAIEMRKRPVRGLTTGDGSYGNAKPFNDKRWVT